MTDATLLANLTRAISAGSVEVIDLTETLREDYPTIILPEEFSQAWGFKKEVISKYDENGPYWSWSNFSMSEHTGTHFDAPQHWISGKDVVDGSVDTMPTKDFIAPVVVIDCSAEVKNDLGFILTKTHLLEWEKEHGKIEAGSWIFMRSDWRHATDPKNYINMQEDGAHSPGPDPEAVLWMIEERDAFGFGTECIGTDAGQAHLFEPQYPCHYYMHGAGKYGLQCMTNLNKLPPKGAVIIAQPLKIEGGSGSPLRVSALIMR